jgi:2-dehydro-3-deoxyphosphogluconate aldolase / (4S)-4-hydroxy-2-oxoglutarate aldolase
MAKFTRLQVALKIHETGLVPIFYHPDLEISKNIVRACYDGGIRVIEYTNRGDFAHELFAELNKYIFREIPEMILGVGSIVDAPTAALYMQIGANFIVSPVLKEEIALVCNKRKIAWVPGCGSVSEISRAEELGAEFVKVFPAQSVGGPDFVKSVKGPMPWTSFMITGGVEPTEENLKKWFTAGASCVGMGSNLITTEVLKNKDYSLLQRNVENALAIINKVKGK